MKKILILLVLCLGSINMYAQRDTIFCLESNIPTIVVLIVPDSVYNAEATLEQNWKVWSTKKTVELSNKFFFEYKGFNAYQYKTKKSLIFDENTQRCIVLDKSSAREKYFPWEIILLFIEVLLFFSFCLLHSKIPKNIKFFIVFVISFFVVFLMLFFFLFWYLFFFENNTITDPTMPITAMVLAATLAPTVNFLIRKKVKNKEKEYPEVGGDLRG